MSVLQPDSPCRIISRFNYILIILFLCFILCTVAASAADIFLTTSSIEQYRGGISYTGTDPLVITIGDNATISSTGSAGIESTAPVTIRSPAGKTLTITVHNDSTVLYGITAPSVSLESGNLAITVNGNNDGEMGNALGIGAVAGNVTIAGGSVSTIVETTGHKNKGIYASRYILISGGRVTTDERGGSNTFGLDGGDVKSGNTDNGVLITGGLVSVSSVGGKNRNVGIDSKFGTVRISGNPVIFIYEDKSGKVQNYACNASITTISGGRAVVFASDGGNFILRDNATLARDAKLLSGKTFEIPSGRSLAIADGTFLTKPAGTVLISGGSAGTFTYARSFEDAEGATTYAGHEPTPGASVPVAVVLAGFSAAVLLIKKD